jgi:hypothetical protein
MLVYYECGQGCTWRVVNQCAGGTAPDSGLSRCGADLLRRVAHWSEARANNATLEGTVAPGQEADWKPCLSDGAFMSIPPVNNGFIAW